jgi:hypothetical protein
MWACLIPFLVTLLCCLPVAAQVELAPGEYIVSEWVVWDDAWYGPEATSTPVEQSIDTPSFEGATDVEKPGEHVEGEPHAQQKSAVDASQDADLAQQLESAVNELLELHQSTMPYDEHVAVLKRQRQIIAELSEQRESLLRSKLEAIDAEPARADPNAESNSVPQSESVNPIAALSGSNDGAEAEAPAQAEMEASPDLDVDEGAQTRDDADKRQSIVDQLDAIARRLAAR